MTSGFANAFVYGLQTPNIPLGAPHSDANRAMTDGVLEWDDDLSSAYRSAMRQAAADGLPLGRLFDPALGDADRDRVFRWYQRCHEAIRLPMAHAVPSRQAVFVGRLA